MLRRLRRVWNSSASIPVLNSLEAYNRWASSYPPQAHNALMQTEEAALVSLLPDLRGKVVLDLACGTGRYGLLAEARGAKQVIGVDHSAAMLVASPLHQRALASADVVPLAARSIDIILCGLAFGHLPDIRPALREMGRILTPGGSAFISDIHPIIALNGAQRTFTGTDGKIYAVEHYPHLYSDYHRAAREAGLKIVEVVEQSVEGAPTSVPAVIVYALQT